MKSVLRSAKPYWIYLILTGKKKIEVGKDFPTSADWNKVVEMYCSKDKRSFNRIPKEDREWMRKYLGRVACQFVCDRIEEFHEWQLSPQGKFHEMEQKDLDNFLKASCLSYEEVCAYRENLPYYKPLYVWNISDLKIYDKPKELGEFRIYCEDRSCLKCKRRERKWYSFECSQLDSPPQSWCYVEELKEEQKNG